MTDTSVPTITDAIKIPWGDWLVQLEDNLKPIAEAVGEEAYQKFVPPLAQAFLGQNVVKQYTDQAVVALEGIEKGQVLTINFKNQVVASAVRLITSAEPALMKYLSTTVEPMIVSYLQSIGMWNVDQKII